MKNIFWWFVTWYDSNQDPQDSRGEALSSGDMAESVSAVIKRQIAAGSYGITINFGLIDRGEPDFE